MRLRRKDLDWIFSVQHERTVNNDNTVALATVLSTGQDALAQHAGRTNGDGS